MSPRDFNGQESYLEWKDGRLNGAIQGRNLEFCKPLKSISLIHEPDVIERILRHLGLWQQHPDPHEGKIKAPADGPVVLDHFDDGWPGYEEAAIMIH